MFESIGVLKYHDNSYKLIVDVDQGICNYYTSLLPKHIRLNKQKYKSHISVVRNEIPDLNFWNKYENEEIKFLYDPEVKFNELYCWLNIWCNRLEEIRQELGLPVSSRFTLPPEGFTKCFHCTIGNFKNI